MNNQFDDLAHPVAWEVKGILTHSQEEAAAYVGTPEALYSQEYVDALLRHITELEQRLEVVREKRDNALLKNSELEELAQPIGISFKSDIALMQSGLMMHRAMTVWKHYGEIDDTQEGVYSQEYVSSLLDALKASQAIANEYRDLMHHMDAGGDFYQFQRNVAQEKAQ